MPEPHQAADTVATSNIRENWQVMRRLTDVTSSMYRGQRKILSRSFRRTQPGLHDPQSELHWFPRLEPPSTAHFPRLFDHRHARQTSPSTSTVPRASEPPATPPAVDSPPAALAGQTERSEMRHNPTLPPQTGAHDITRRGCRRQDWSVVFCCQRPRQFAAGFEVLMRQTMQRQTLVANHWSGRFAPGEPGFPDPHQDQGLRLPFSGGLSGRAADWR